MQQKIKIKNSKKEKKKNRIKHKRRTDGISYYSKCHFDLSNLHKHFMLQATTTPTGSSIVIVM